MKKIILSLVIIGLIIWGVISLGKREAPKPQPGEREIEQEASVPTETTPEIISYQGKEGVDALTLLKEKAEVVTEDFEGKPMVKSINGVEANEQNFWAFYVNGEMSMVGAAEYKTKDSDQIEWRYQPIQ